MLQLHFLEQIVNVHWSTYRDMVMVFGISGPPQFFIKFTTPKTSYAVGATPLPAPVFGTAKNVPTDTRDVVPGAQFPTDNRVVATSASIFIDHKAYSYVSLREWVGEISTLTGQYEFYSPSGEKLAAGQEPPEVAAGHKGKVVTHDEDDGGTVYAQAGGEGGSGRIYKLDSFGDVAWTIDGEPRTVNYDEDTQHIIVPGLEGNSEINIYDLSGSFLLTIDLDFGPINDVSRKGKVYCRNSSEETTFSGMVGYTKNGTELFNVPGEAFDGGSQWGNPVAYGEDYIVSTANGPQDNDVTFVDLGGGATITTTVSTLPYYIMVFNANTGSVISKTLWGTESITTVLHSGPPTPENSIDQSSYSGFQIFRSAYLPPRPEEEEETA